MQHVYIIRCGRSQAFKVGVSKNPQRRLAQLQTGCPSRLSIVFHQPVRDAWAVESTVHATLRSHGAHVMNEWFKLSDDEVISVADQILKHAHEDAG